MRSLLMASPVICGEITDICRNDPQADFGNKLYNRIGEIHPIRGPHPLQVSPESRDVAQAVTEYAIVCSGLR